METHEAREAAADYLAAVLESAYNNISIDEIEKAYEVEFEDAMSILFEMGGATAAIWWETDECTCEDPLEDVSTGDADPTADLDEDRDVCSATNGSWLCTRESSHPGNHIAGDGDEVCDVWQ